MSLEESFSVDGAKRIGRTGPVVASIGSEIRVKHKYPVLGKPTTCGFVRAIASQRISASISEASQKNKLERLECSDQIFIPAS